MTAANDLLLDGLREVTGDARAELDSDGSVPGLAPRLRVTPANPDELAACLRVVDESGSAVVPWGGGTQQRIGAAPARLDVALSTSRLDAIVEWEPADLTACLQAGATLSDIHRALAVHGQQLAIDAPAAGRATLGGLVATNVCGPRRWLYGGWRDQVIGMQMALASGDLIKSGGRVVKNVQGYDLAKLFIGSLGTLGVVTQVNVKLTPLPAFRRLFVARGALDSGADFLSQVADSPLRVSALDLLDGRSARVCGFDGEECAALILVEGARTAVDGQSSRLNEMAAAMSMKAETAEGEAVGPIWRDWVALGRTDDLGDGEALFSVAAKPSDTLAVLRGLSESAARHEVTAACWARAGNGAIYARLAQADVTTPAQTRTAAGRFEAIQSELLPRWPATAVVGGSPAIQQAVRPWGAPPAAVDLMRALKQRFDPNSTLQPGRFVGGM